ncbi:hypothetical protein CCR94_24140 [Rhodoblastus sphagnicola]|uniref:N-acetyltransferase domain-containing protein n=2 Tax=Rhodoblastus sphagnicola TaxID=333368 RepID=A0A2S6MU37_9HYPH|nr:hypothetical protein CCR94_24140 [Rhodoblastus sphagnicola]
MNAFVSPLEERASNAWPAARAILVGGWAFRFANGFSKRANSANALFPNTDFAEVRQAAECFYTRHRLPVIFRLTPLAPPEADSALEQAGYARIEPCRVMVADIGAVARGSLSLDDAPSPQWLDGFARASGESLEARRDHAALLERIFAPRVFATAHRQGAPVGFGMAVRERGQIGLFDLMVAPEHRGSGIGRKIMQALLHWGREAGARQAYLQVHQSNAVALNLYESFGFRAGYDYHYRFKPI